MQTIASLLLLIASNSPTIEVEHGGLERQLGADVNERFYGDLLSRLLEAGYAVADDGDATLSILGTRDSVVLELREGELRSIQELDTTQAPVLALELLHRALALVDAVDWSEHQGPQRTMSWLEAEVAETRYSRLVAALVNAGVVLAPSPAQAQQRLCVYGTDQPLAPLELVIVPIDQSCKPGQASAYESLTALAIAAATPQTSPEPEAAPPSRGAKEAVSPSKTPPKLSAARRRGHVYRPPGEWMVYTPVYFAFQARWDDHDYGIGLGAEALSPFGVAFGVRTQIYPSRKEQLQLTDTFIAATAHYHSPWWDRIGLFGGVEVGALLHSFRYQGNGTELRGDFDLALPIGLRVAAHKNVLLHLSTWFGYSVRERTHAVDGELVWERSPYRIGVALGFTPNFP